MAETSEQVRRKAKHTLLASCAVLAKEGLFTLVPLILGLVEPLYSQRSDNETLARSPPEAAAYYLAMAQCQWMVPLEAVCKQMEDLVLLTSLGFTTDWDSVGGSHMAMARGAGIRQLARRAMSRPPQPAAKAPAGSEAARKLSSSG